ncbi:MAG: protease modulator HflC [Spirochaetales bacterium]|nr:protease modulator HflC [Spirochaetales bacterium]
MKKPLIITALIVGVVALVILIGPYYILTEGEQAVIVEFGKIVRIDTEAGLHLKTPFVASVSVYPKKIQSWDGSAQRLPTSENQFIWVDTTARWRIADLKKFFESVGSIGQAHSRLDDVIDSEVRKIIARNPLREAVRNSNVISEIERANVVTGLAGEGESAESLSSISTFAEIKFEPVSVGRDKQSVQMLEEARRITPDYGIELIDLIIRQIKYSDDLTQSVYDRMIKERNQIAQAFRSDGEGERQKWLGQMERELQQIQSEAARKAKEIMAKADAEALQIRNSAYNRDPAFADYWMAMQEYRALLPKFRKTLTTDADFFKYLYNRRAR